MSYLKSSVYSALTIQNGSIIGCSHYVILNKFMPSLHGISLHETDTKIAFFSSLWFSFAHLFFVPAG